jgi:hypothetical protein
MRCGIWDVSKNNSVLSHISELTSHICYLFVIFVSFVVNMYFPFYSTSSWTAHSLRTNFSSTSMRIAFVGHIWAQTPQPLQ